MSFFRLCVKTWGRFLLVLTPVTVFLGRAANTDVQCPAPFPPAFTCVMLVAQVLCPVAADGTAEASLAARISGLLRLLPLQPQRPNAVSVGGILPVCPTSLRHRVPLHVPCLRTRAGSKADRATCPRLGLPRDTSLSRKPSGKRWARDSQA